jgi:hypothetical protein
MAMQSAALVMPERNAQYTSFNLRGIQDSFSTLIHDFGALQKIYVAYQCRQHATHKALALILRVTVACHETAA